MVGTMKAALVAVALMLLCQLAECKVRRTRALKGKRNSDNNKNYQSPDNLLVPDHSSGDTPSNNNNKPAMKATSDVMSEDSPPTTADKSTDATDTQANSADINNKDVHRFLL